MKCKMCNGCLKVTRIDLEEVTEAFWYCYFCDTAKAFTSSGKSLENDKEVLKVLRKEYEDKYGKRV